MLREFGDLDSGIAELRKALRLAREIGSVKREGDVLASLAVALVYAGRTAAGLAAFDRALRISRGALRPARCSTGAASRCWPWAGMPRPWTTRARATELLRRTGDNLWTARAMTSRGLIYHALGFPARADAAFADAEHLLAETSQVLESVYMVHNRALVASR